jgi:hypothetical protein
VKNLLIRLLGAVGLAPARSFHSQAQLTAEAKAGALVWKTKAADAMDRVKALEAEVKRQAHLIQTLTTSSEKLRQHQDHVEQLLRVRLVEAEQVLVLAREHLMAIDVKLDILEGAANVLDTRTRAAIAKQHDAVSASS